MTLSISLDCLHHQGALAKRPALLGSGLPSTLVRMAHCHQNSLFTRTFDDVLEHYADHVVQRVCVHTLPEASAEWRQRNYDLLRPCRIKWKTLAPFCRIFPSWGTQHITNMKEICTKLFIGACIISGTIPNILYIPYQYQMYTCIWYVQYIGNIKLQYHITSMYFSQYMCIYIYIAIAICTMYTQYVIINLWYVVYSYW